MKTKKHECEAWMLVDAAGDYGVGHDEETAQEAYEAEYTHAVRRMVRVKVLVEVPEFVEIVAECPMTDAAQLVEAK